MQNICYGRSGEQPTYALLPTAASSRGWPRLGIGQALAASTTFPAARRACLRSVIFGSLIGMRLPWPAQRLGIRTADSGRPAGCSDERERLSALISSPVNS